MAIGYVSRGRGPKKEGGGKAGRTSRCGLSSTHRLAPRLQWFWALLAGFFAGREVRGFLASGEPGHCRSSSNRSNRRSRSCADSALSPNSALSASPLAASMRRSDRSGSVASADALDRLGFHLSIDGEQFRLFNQRGQDGERDGMGCRDALAQRCNLRGKVRQRPVLAHCSEVALGESVEMLDLVFEQRLEHRPLLGN